MQALWTVSGIATGILEGRLVDLYCPAVAAPNLKPTPAKENLRATANPPALAQPVTSLWGVGQERAFQLARLEIRTVEDLLLHRPRRYEDRR